MVEKKHFLINFSLKFRPQNVTPCHKHESSKREANINKKLLRVAKVQVFFLTGREKEQEREETRRGQSKNIDCTVGICKKLAKWVMCHMHARTHIRAL